MTAAPQLRAAPRPSSPTPPSLRLVRHPAAAPPPSRREVAFAATLTLVLVVGVVGVLLLNTSMQRQADRIAAQRQHIAAVSLTLQKLHTALDRQADPAVLAARARALHMRPVRTLRFVRLSAPSPAAGRAHAG